MWQIPPDNILAMRAIESSERGINNNWEVPPRRASKCPQQRKSVDLTFARRLRRERNLLSASVKQPRGEILLVKFDAINVVFLAGEPFVYVRQVRRQFTSLERTKLLFVIINHTFDLTHELN